MVDVDDGNIELGGGQRGSESGIDVAGERT